MNAPWRKAAEGRFAPTADLVLSWIDRVSAKTVKAPATG
jgi:hypothetical protein